MRILITGGAGFIGSHLCDLFLGNGNEVVCMDNLITGNPDNIAHTAATTWGSYDISKDDDLKGEDYEVAHRGYDTRYVRQDPDRMVPVDVMRELESEGVVGKLHDEFISPSGLANPLANSRRLGQQIAQKLKDSGVDAVILTSA